MNKIILLAALLSLAGCASTTDKAAVADAAPVAVVASEVPAGSEPQVVAEVPVTAAPVQEQAVQPVAQAPAELSGWEQLSRRVLAWGDPMRRSMEQYCPPESTTSNH